MIRVVDTNIVISALLTPLGLSAQVLALCLTDVEIQPFVSAKIYAEYEEVALRPRFKRTRQEVSALLNAVRDVLFGSSHAAWFGAALILGTTFSLSVLKRYRHTIS